MARKQTPRARVPGHELVRVAPPLESMQRQSVGQRVMQAAKREAAAAARRQIAPPKRWATDEHLAIAKDLVPVPPPAPPEPQPHITTLERRWQLHANQRRTLIPHMWAAGTGVVGTLGWGFGELLALTASPGAASTSGLVIGGAAAATTAAVGAAKRKDLVPHGHRFALAGAASTTWITTASLTGLSWWQMALLGLGDVVIGAGLWRQLRHERRELKAAPNYVEPEPEPQPQQDVAEVAEPDLVAEYITRWRLNVGGQGGVLEGSQLIAARETDIGVEAIVLLNPKRHRLDVAIGAIPQIRPGLGLAVDGGDDEPGEEVLIDQPARIGETRLTSDQVRIQIIRKSPVRRSPWMERATFADGKPGVCLVGKYADGKGFGPWLLFDRDGVWSGTIIGGTGGGKSSIMDVIAINARAAGMTIGYIDPQSGASSPVMAENASWIALGEDQIIPAVQALEELARRREQWVRLHPKMGGIIVPGKAPVCEPGCQCGGIAPPGMIVFIDECDLAFNMPNVGPDGKASGKLATRWGQLAKKIRKLGVGFVGATQVSGLSAFGSDDLLRSSMATRNLMAFHVGSIQGGTLIPGLPLNPAQIAKRPGYAVIAGDAARTAPLRTFWAPRSGKDSDVGAPVFAEQLFARYPDPGLHPMDAACIRTTLPDPTIAARRSWEEANDAIGALMSGAPAPQQRTESPDASRGGIPMVPAPVIPMRRNQLDPAALRELDRAVLAIMADGHTRTGSIVEAYGEDNRTNRRKVHDALRRLEQAEWVIDGGHGVWHLTEAARRLHSAA
jgi:hypothetical protein